MHKHIAIIFCGALLIMSPARTEEGQTSGLLTPLPPSEPAMVISLSNWTLWWEFQTGVIANWALNNTNRVGSTSLTPSAGPNWRVRGTADFNHDGQTDLLLHHVSGFIAVWELDGNHPTNAVYLNPKQVSTQWQPLATGDMNGDGESDIIWQHQSGTVAVWFMKELQHMSNAYLTPLSAGITWRVAGVADFNLDGQNDIIWREPATGRLLVWFMNGTQRISQLAPPFMNPTWRLAAIADVNGDTHPDLVWEHQFGALGVSFMGGANGITRLGFSRLNPSSVLKSWQIVGPK